MLTRVSFKALYANFLNLHIDKATKTSLFNHTFYETNFKRKLFTANVECNGTILKEPKTEKAVLFLNLSSRSIWWRPRVLVQFQPCCTLPT